MKRKTTVICNGCGRKIRTGQGALTEDFFEGQKNWGYFSGKDMEHHHFILCEACYDKMVAGFVISPGITEVTELSC